MVNERANTNTRQKLGDARCPSAHLVAIQAANGTGETVVGALIAARLATADPDRLVVAAAMTNGAIAQFSESVLRLSEYRYLNSLYFITDTALVDGTPTTPIDLHSKLNRLAMDYHDQMGLVEYNTCCRYALGRRLLEEALFRLELTAQLTDKEREEYRIAERENPETTTKAFRIMYCVRRSNIVYITTASLLNSTASSDCWVPYSKSCDVIICDEASQISRTSNSGGDEFMVA
ncbi:hypothetical protein Q1695_015706 [Nippostrongylus brasiliensis]|nr:hypothetical protein Q1695_015706 [Nippostrongylus brasiliensis]